MGNAPIVRVDIDGRRCKLSQSGGSRATVECEACDRLESLEEVVPFEIKEYERWLKSDDGKSMPVASSASFGAARKFSVPNTVYVVVGAFSDRVEKASSWPVYVQAAAMSAAATIAGFRSVLDSDLSFSAMPTYFGSEDIYGLVYYGHGPGLLARDAPDSVEPMTVLKWLHHGLGAMAHNGCFSANPGFASGLGWDSVVARRGTFSGETELVSPYTIPFYRASTHGTYSPK